LAASTVPAAPMTAVTSAWWFKCFDAHRQVAKTIVWNSLTEKAQMWAETLRTLEPAYKQWTAAQVTTWFSKQSLDKMEPQVFVQQVVNKFKDMNGVCMTTLLMLDDDAALEVLKTVLDIQPKTRTKKVLEILRSKPGFGQ
jgi:hypothetical protein